MSSNVQQEPQTADDAGAPLALQQQKSQGICTTEWQNTYEVVVAIMSSSGRFIASSALLRLRDATLSFLAPRPLYLQDGRVCGSLTFSVDLLPRLSLLPLRSSEDVGDAVGEDAAILRGRNNSTGRQDARQQSKSNLLEREARSHPQYRHLNPSDNPLDAAILSANIANNGAEGLGPSRREQEDGLPLDRNKNLPATSNTTRKNNKLLEQNYPTSTATPRRNLQSLPDNEIHINVTTGEEVEMRCGKCDNRGYMPCTTCNGYGFLLCDLCDGRGAFSCERCGNTGYKQQDVRGITADDRDPQTAQHVLVKRGREICEDCWGEVKACAGCVGLGRIRCPSCSGTCEVRCNVCGGEQFAVLSK
ncbi:unnamed protein product [Amoebophrya sp. A25]|nr:unnamed protein product [Amoebophrya sp. A25]|eukprot:GSA25T00024185001.1